MTYYFLVQGSKLAWARSGNRPAMYDTLAQARKWRPYQCPGARILRLEFLAAGPTVTFVPDGVPGE